MKVLAWLLVAIALICLSPALIVLGAVWLFQWAFEKAGVWERSYPGERW